MLLGAQKDVSPADIRDLFIVFNWEPETLVSFISMDLIQYELMNYGHYEEDLHPALRWSLSYYGNSILPQESSFWGQSHSVGWETVLRKLLRIGVSIHTPIFRQSPDRDCEPRRKNPFISTPLDCLFHWVTEPCETRQIAHEWLHILSTEGYDITEYLKREAALHSEDGREPCTMFYRDYSFDDCYAERELFFEYGETPGVYADCWIDPDSSTFLLREAFKDMQIMNAYPQCWGWPLYFDPFYEMAQKRAQRTNRHWRKKAQKAARRNGIRTHTSMPGAWPSG